MRFSPSRSAAQRGSAYAEGCPANCSRIACSQRRREERGGEEARRPKWPPHSACRQALKRPPSPSSWRDALTNSPTRRRGVRRRDVRLAQQKALGPQPVRHAGRTIRGMFTWSILGAAFNGPLVVYRYRSTEVARLMQRVDTGAWFAVLDQHRPHPERRRRPCSSFEGGQAGVELWAARHADRLVAEVAAIEAAWPARRWMGAGQPSSPGRAGAAGSAGNPRSAPEVTQRAAAVRDREPAP